MSNAEQMYTCQAMQSLFSKLCWRLNKVYDSFAKAMHRTIPFMNFEIRHHVISLVGLYDGHLNCFLRLVEIEELSFLIITIMNAFLLLCDFALFGKEMEKNGILHICIITKNVNASLQSFDIVSNMRHSLSKEKDTKMKWAWIADLKLHSFSSAYSLIIFWSFWEYSNSVRLCQVKKNCSFCWTVLLMIHNRNEKRT